MMLTPAVAEALLTRRTVLKSMSLLCAAAAAGSAITGCSSTPSKPDARRGTDAAESRSPLFTISLAQWSLHRTLRSGTLDPFDFPLSAKRDYGIDAVEYVNTFYRERHDRASIAELRKRCGDAGVSSLLIMCDGEGHLGDPDAAARRTAVDNHRKWLDAARDLGCHSIRVNAQSRGSYAEQQRLAADGLRALCEVAEPYGLHVIVENHGGLSSNGAWLADVIRMVGHPRAGTLPDFGNFRIAEGQEYDRYRGVAELMPFARGVSAKSHEFASPLTAGGDEVRTDYRRMLRIVLDAGYRGRIGIEYEGDGLSERDGIIATRQLLERVRDELSADGRYA